VADDLAGFDSAPADFLPPGNLGPAERVQPEAWEIAVGTRAQEIPDSLRPSATPEIIAYGAVARVRKQKDNLI